MLVCSNCVVDEVIILRTELRGIINEVEIKFVLLNMNNF